MSLMVGDLWIEKKRVNKAGIYAHALPLHLILQGQTCVDKFIYLHQSWSLVMMASDTVYMCVCSLTKLNEYCRVHMS